MQMILQAIINRSFTEIIEILEQIAFIIFFEEDEEGREGYEAFRKRLNDCPEPMDELRKLNYRMIYKRLDDREEMKSMAEAKFYSEMAQSRMYLDFLEEICDELITNAQRLKSVTVLRTDAVVTRVFPIGQERSSGGEKAGNQAFSALNTLLDLSECITNYQIKRKAGSTEVKSEERTLMQFLRSISLQLSKGTKGESTNEHGVRYGLSNWLGDYGRAADRLCRLIEATLLDIARVDDLQKKLTTLFRKIGGNRNYFTTFLVEYLDFQKNLYYSPKKNSTATKNQVRDHLREAECFNRGGFTCHFDISTEFDLQLFQEVSKLRVRVSRDDSVLVKQLPKYLVFLHVICPRVFDLFYPNQDKLKLAAEDYIDMVVSSGMWETDDPERLVFLTNTELDRLEIEVRRLRSEKALPLEPIPEPDPEEVKKNDSQHDI
jgi:hypothetical protein